MKANGTLALLTDFGTRDWYVASMKGAAMDAFADIRLIDISHSITPGSIQEGAFVLKQCYDDFPHGTTFAVVVDPGVGTERIPIMVETQDYCFVGPDNGVLFPALEKEEILQQVHIEAQAWKGNKNSATFHGRDIFAPAAALAASGAPIHDAGPGVDKLVPFELPKPRGEGSSLLGQILYFDTFGNGLTNFRAEHVDTSRLIGLRVEDTLFPLATTFGEVDEGAPVSYWGSSGFLEVATREGNAQSDYNLADNSVVGLVFSSHG